jgi:hypothetical protein
MGSSFFAYIRLMEVMAFFTGYTLLYAIIFLIFGNHQAKNNFNRIIVSLLPFSYALVATLYFGLQLKYTFHDAAAGNLRSIMGQPFLAIWGIIAMLFWIPAIARKTSLSLMHSLVFFFFLVRDLYMQLFAFANKDILRNDMRIFTLSLLLNLAAFGLILLIFYFVSFIKKNTET